MGGPSRAAYSGSPDRSSGNRWTSFQARKACIIPHSKWSTSNGISLLTTWPPDHLTILTSRASEVYTAQQVARGARGATLGGGAAATRWDEDQTKQEIKTNTDDTKKKHSQRRNGCNDLVLSCYLTSKRSVGSPCLWRYVFGSKGGQLDPPVSDGHVFGSKEVSWTPLLVTVTFLDQRRSVGPPCWWR